jgi:hypothetical protein
MKQLLPLFLFLLPCLALAQYPSNGNQKITLGEQTTADGLIYRGVLADTGIITPLSDTSAYIILDTVNHRFYNYNRATNVWSMAGVGSISSGLTGVLPVANGGTGATTFTSNQILKGNGTSSILNSNLFSSGTTLGLNTSTFPDWFPNVLHVQGTANTGLVLSSTNGNSFFQFATFSTPTVKGSIIHNNGFRFARSSGRNLENYTDIMILDTLLRVGINIGNNGNPTEPLHVGGNTRITGNIAAGVTSATARLHLVAGTATASTAPLKFTTGTLLTTPEAGAMEYLTTNLYFTPNTAVRHNVNHGLTGSATLNFPSTTTLLSADLTITVTGAADGDVVSLGVPNAAVNANTSYSAWVSAANTVTVRFNNYSSGTVDPASALFKVFVTK